MRTFSDFEKDQITKTASVQLADSNILNFITKSILDNRALLISYETKTVSFIYKIEDSLALTEFFELIGLLEYLKTNHLIFVHKDLSIEDASGFVNTNLTPEIFNQNSDNYTNQIIPTDIYNLLQDYRKSFFITGTELKKLIQSNFKTSEEIRFEKEISIARLSFIIALIALIFSLLSPFLFETTIDQNQIDELKLNLKKTELKK